MVVVLVVEVLVVVVGSPTGTVSDYWMVWSAPLVAVYARQCHCNGPARLILAPGKEDKCEQISMFTLLLCYGKTAQRGYNI